MNSLNLKLKPLDMETGRNIVVMHEDDANALGHITGDRVKVITPKASVTMIANTTRKMVQKGELGAFMEAAGTLGVPAGADVEVKIAPRPLSAAAIKKKMSGQQLNSEEIRSIVQDIVSDNLTTTEMTAFVVGGYTRDMTMDEIVALTQSMVEAGDRLDLDVEPILDVHSIGGVPGNKYAMITVPIVAAAGLTIPKTSSRAITSAAGTADVMEVLANVTLTMDEIRSIAKKVGGVLAWGGSVRLAPADDIIIRIERMLGIDPRGQLLASVMSKKMAVGADRIVIDVPTGHGSKVEDADVAKKLAHDFIDLGYKLGIQLESAITYGGQPIGYTIGPALEAREALETLMGKGPGSLIEKSTSLAGLLLELGGAAPRGIGRQMATEILNSGKAYNKFKEIIEAQGGNPNVKPEDIPIGRLKEVVTASSPGYIKRILNQRINEIARTAGAPQDKGAGVRVILKEGRKVGVGDPIFEIYSNHETRLDEALAVARRSPPIHIEGILLETLSHRAKFS